MEARSGRDPVFSPLGDLLSLPAIMASSAAAQANFGFVVKFTSGASAPKGNLQYQDHDADVRIKATSYGSLIIAPASAGRTLTRHSPVPLMSPELRIAHGRGRRLR